MAELSSGTTSKQEVYCFPDLDTSYKAMIQAVGSTDNPCLWPGRGCDLIFEPVGSKLFDANIRSTLLANKGVLKE